MNEDNRSKSSAVCKWLELSPLLINVYDGYRVNTIIKIIKFIVIVM